MSPRLGTRGIVAKIRDAVDASRSAADRLVLAVSGGIDSMVLLDAVGRRGNVVVATFDHGTGPAARRACDLVEREAAARGLECVVGRAQPGVRPSEAAWRDARWAFLRSV